MILRLWVVACVVFGSALSVPTCPKRRPYDDDCQKYIECNNGRDIVYDCGSVSYFDPEALQCKQGQCTVQLIPDQRNCSRYIAQSQYPESRRKVDRECPRDTLFDSEKLECVPSSQQVNCATDCYEGETQVMEGQPKAFRLCVHGVWTVKNCPEGLLYDYKTGKCSQCSFTDKIISQSNCNVYSQCSLGQYSDVKCPWMKTFNNVTKECEYSWSCIKANYTVEGCTEGDRVVDYTDCQKYWECRHGGWIQDSCWYLRRFNNSTKQCQFGLKCVQAPAVMALWKMCNDGEKVIDATDCQKYWECKKNEWSEQKCGWFRKFNNQTHKCEYSNKCITRKLNTVAAKAWTMCTDGERIIDTTDCQKYWECQKGQWNEEKCGWFRKFNNQTHKCEFSTKCIQTKVSHRSKREATCVEGNKVQDLNDASCKKYKQCVKGEWVNEECGWFRKFNPNKKSCEYSTKCIPYTGPTDPPTTEAPTTKPEPPSSQPTKYPVIDLHSGSTNPPEIPSDVPTGNPTEAPTDVPTEPPTENPTEPPTEAPTEQPTEPPTEKPTEPPTEAPTENPTEPPTEKPTEPPTETPTENPTEPPTEAPTEKPTEPPTEEPTEPPTEPPTEKPTEPPTEPPTEKPTEPPTEPPTEKPTEPPTEPPTKKPTPPPTPAPECMPGDVRRMGLSCKDYNLCNADGRWTNRTCSAWCKNFDGKKCNWKWNHPCTDPTTTPQPSTGQPTKQPTNQPTKKPTNEPTPQPSPTSSPEPGCTEGELKPYPGDCYKYQQCQANQFIVQSCTLYRKFDKNELKCKYFATC